MKLYIFFNHFKLKVSLSYFNVYYFFKLVSLFTYIRKKYFKNIINVNIKFVILTYNINVHFKHNNHNTYPYIISQYFINKYSILIKCH